MTSLETRSASPPPSSALEGGSWVATALHSCLAAAAGLFWLVSLPQVDPSAMTGWGLLSAVPWTWWPAAAVTAPYLVAAVHGRCPASVLCAYQAVLLAVLFGTTSATYPAPRFPWTYKHVGVVEHMLANGVDRSIDIYNNWPGFFLGAAGISRLTGLDPLDLAQWAEPCFAAATSAALVFAVRGLTNDRRIVWVALLVFTLGNWVAQNYFSPQAVATVLALLFLGCVIRWLPVRDASGRPVPRPWVAILLRGRDPAPLAALDRVPAWGLPAATVLFVGIVISHQLTPVAVLLQVGVLALLLRLTRPWMIALWVLPEAAWLAYTWDFIEARWNIFSPGVAGPEDTQATLVPSLPGVAVAASAPRALIAVIGLSAAYAFAWRYARGRSAELVALALAVGPPMILALQSYGGEGIFRAYLFALPWLSYLVGLLVVALWSRGGWRRPLLGAATAMVTGVALLAMLGSELVGYVPERTLAASRWFEANTPEGAYAVRLDGAGFPLLLTDDYVDHLIPAPMLNARPGFTPGDTPPDELLGLAREAFEWWGPGGHFVVTEDQYAYSRMYGQAPPAQIDELVTAISSSDDYRVVYRDGRNVIAEYVAPLDPAD